MAKHPDVYADGFSISAGQFGLTLTLTRTEPTGEPGAHQEPAIVVARVRMNQNLARAVSESMSQMLAAAAQGLQETSTNIRH